MSLECVSRLRNLVTKSHVGDFRRALVMEPPADMDPMTVQLKPGAHLVHAGPCSTASIPAAQGGMADNAMECMVAAYTVYRNNQAIYGSIVMAILKDKNVPVGIGLSCRECNNRTGRIPVAKLGEPGKEICTLDLLRGCWQTPLSLAV